MHVQDADLYLRLSHGRPGIGLEVQERDCRDWALRNGVRVRAVHVDHGKSGFSADVQRHGFDAALNAVTSGVVGMLIVWKVDRVTRRGVDHLRSVLEELDKHGGRLVSAQEELDSADPIGRLVMEKLAELALAESENLSLRVRSAKRYLRSQGRWIGGAASYGLIIRDGRLAIDPMTGPIVREMARRALDGQTLTEVTTWLNSEGIASPRGGQWNVGSVSQLLRGPATAGLLPETMKNASGTYTNIVRPWRDPDTGETVSVMADGEEPLISPADQDAIASRVGERGRRWPAKRGSVRAESGGGHLLTGLLRCAGCGSRMSLNGNSYRCQAVRLGRSCAAPGGAYRPAIEQAIERVWTERLATLDAGETLAEAVVRRWWFGMEPNASAQLGALNVAVDDLNDQLALTDEEWVIHGRLTREDRDVLAAPLTQSIAELKRRIEDLSPQVDDLWSLIDLTDVAKGWAQADVAKKRALLRLAIAEIWVCQGVRGQRFDAAARLTVVWASNPTTVTGNNDSGIDASERRNISHC